jgi:hypothetical protein
VRQVHSPSKSRRDSLGGSELAKSRERVGGIARERGQPAMKTSLVRFKQ